jgi:hypothetical protein
MAELTARIPNVEQMINEGDTPVLYPFSDMARIPPELRGNAQLRIGASYRYALLHDGLLMLD